MKKIFFALLLLFPTLAYSETWPDKTVKFVVPNPPGLTTDILARIYTDELQKKYDVPFIVENRPGAGVVVGTNYVHESPPDSHLFLLSTSTLAVAQTTVKAAKFDVRKDFVIVAPIADFPMIAVVAHDRYKSFDEIIAKAKSGQQVFYGTTGPGTSAHLITEKIKKYYKFDAQPVFYKDYTSEFNDLLGHRIDFYFMTSIVIKGAVEGKKLLPVLISGDRKVSAFGDIPTTKEQGCDDCGVSLWHAIFAKAGTPDSVIKQLNKDLNEITNSERIQSTLRDQIGFPINMTYEQAKIFWKTEVDRLEKVVKETGLEVQ